MPDGRGGERPCMKILNLQCYFSTVHPLSPAISPPGGVNARVCARRVYASELRCDSEFGPRTAHNEPWRAASGSSGLCMSEPIDTVSHTFSLSLSLSPSLSPSLSLFLSRSQAGQQAGASEASFLFTPGASPAIGFTSASALADEHSLPNFPLLDASS